MIELLALKLKEVSKKASNIDEKIDNLAISQEKEQNDKANAILGWKAQYSLEEALSSAWQWEQKIRNK